jgi:hypothetical protein
MTFEEFQATGRDVDDIGAAIGDEGWLGCPGRVYLGDTLFIEEGRPFPEPAPWVLTIGNCATAHENLEYLERQLYNYAVEELGVRTGG